MNSKYFSVRRGARRHAARVTAGGSPRQGRPPRLPRELRPGRGAGLELLVRASTRSSTRAQPSWRRRLPVAQRLPHLADVRRRQLAGARDPPVRAVGGQPAAIPTAARRRPAHPHRPVRPSAGWRTVFAVPRTPRTGRRARVLRLRPATTTPGTSATADPEFGYASMPDQYTLSSFHRGSSRPDRRR